MSVSCKFERSLLSHNEFETVRLTHHPEIYALDSAALLDVKSRLRGMRDKERTLARQKRREVRGKTEPRGKSFPGTADRPLQRKQIFAAALKRVKKEFNRLRTVEARSAQVEAAHRALAMRRADNFVHHPATDTTANQGMLPLPNRRRRTKVPPSKIGSVSQATKVSQAIRDAKN